MEIVEGEMERTKSHCTEALISLQVSTRSYNDHRSQTDPKQRSRHTLTDSIPPRPSDVAAAVLGFPSLYGLRGELASTVVIVGLKNCSGCKISIVRSVVAITLISA